MCPRSQSQEEAELGGRGEATPAVLKDGGLLGGFKACLAPGTRRLARRLS